MWRRSFGEALINSQQTDRQAGRQDDNWWHWEETCRKGGGWREWGESQGNMRRNTEWSPLQRFGGLTGLATHTFLSLSLSLSLITFLGWGGLPTVRWFWPPLWCGWCWTCSFCSTSVSATSVTIKRKEDYLGEMVSVCRPPPCDHKSTSSFCSILLSVLYVFVCVCCRCPVQAAGRAWWRGEACGDPEGEPGEDEGDV